MIKAKSLHIGLNYVDPNHYSGWNGKLNSCEKDARDMQLIASSQGFSTALLLRENATRKNVILALKEAASELNGGDILYVSYSGHGGQVPDVNGDEEDGLDETWCLFDGQLLDDELKQLWANFGNIRILVTSDSCHSGSVTKEVNMDDIIDTGCIFYPKVIPTDAALSTYMENQAFYQEVAENCKSPKEIAASVLLLSGCQDNQSSYDGPFNGAFTSALKRVWNGGKFNGDYHSFHKKIVRLLPDRQTPNLLFFGSENDYFQHEEKPFSIV